MQKNSANNLEVSKINSKFTRILFRELKHWDITKEPFSNELYNFLPDHERQRIRNICNRLDEPFNNLAFKYHLSPAQIADILNWFEDEKLRFKSMKGYQNLAA